MFSKITLEKLKKIVSPVIIARGRKYYENGAVENIMHCDDEITAIVRGGQVYVVTIGENPGGGIFFDCTCPFQDENICKHSVAAALKVMYEPEAVKGFPSEKPILEDSLFEDLFNKATSEQKEDFLMEILKENKLYWERFRILVLGQVAVESGRAIEEIRDRVKQDLETFGLDDSQWFYDRGKTDDRYYRDYHEIVYDGASNALIELMDKYKVSIMEGMKAGNIIDAFKELLGVYEGIAMVDNESIDDPECIFFEGLSHEAACIFYSYYEEFVDQFRAVTKSENAALRISEIFFQRFVFYRDRILEECDFQYDLYDFKEWSKDIVVCSGEVARYWDERLEELELKEHRTAELEMKIALQLGKNEDWLRVAERNYIIEQAVGEELLRYYKQEGDDKNFLRVAEAVFDKWANHFDEYLFKNLSKNQNVDLYGRIFLNYVERTQSLPLYRKYKELYGEEAARIFVESLKEKSMNRLFYIKLLEEEKDYNVIWETVKNNVNDFEFVDFISPIINVFPERCLKIIRKKTDSFLEHSVGRKYYVEAAQWLSLLSEIKDASVSEDVQRYFDLLFCTYNRRPALKDELKRVGIYPSR